MSNLIKEGYFNQINLKSLWMYQLNTSKLESYERKQRKHEIRRSSYVHMERKMREGLTNLYLHKPEYSYRQHVRMDGLKLLQRWCCHMWLSMIPPF
jgi:hypothetical protein